MGNRSRHRGSGTLACVALAAGTLLLAACGSSTTASPSVPAPPPPTTTSPSPSAGTAASEYLPGLPAQVRYPSADGPAPLIVMVPGGGWSTADPTGLEPLADRLTAAGATTSLITYATTDSGSRFPEAVDDVACAVRWSVDQATTNGHPPTHVVVLGHSAGGHLAALVAFSGDEFGATCPYPAADIDGLIGLAGVYDTDAFQPVLAQWMGTDPVQSPDTWRRVNPLTWLRDGTQHARRLRVLLIHGDADMSVPLSQTSALEKALDDAEVDVQTAVLPGLGHLEVFEAPNAGPPIEGWMQAWPPGKASPTDGS